MALYENQEFGIGIYEKITPVKFLLSIVFSPMGYGILNTPIWMMKYIFEGTFIIVLLHLGIADLKF